MDGQSVLVGASVARVQAIASTPRGSKPISRLRAIPPVVMGS